MIIIWGYDNVNQGAWSVVAVTTTQNASTGDGGTPATVMVQRRIAPLMNRFKHRPVKGTTRKWGH